MKLFTRFTIFTAIIFYGLPLYSFFIVNNTNGPKTVEVVAYQPQKSGFLPKTVFKKELAPHSFARIRDIVDKLSLTVSWGNKRILESINPATKGKNTEYTLYSNSIFRHFRAQEAKPSLTMHGVPEIIGSEHVFEITGSKYNTDIQFFYAPDEESPAMKIIHKQKSFVSDEVLSTKKQKLLEEKTSQRSSILRTQLFTNKQNALLYHKKACYHGVFHQ
jgi:hypothetical protein